MQQITPAFLEQCPVERGFRLRGAEMTRVEVFVDAAFAFAVTMMVISFDAIPRSFPEVVIAIKLIPAFVAAVAQLIWIWYAHAVWCRRFSLDDGTTVWLSSMLLVVVLIYIYPMRIMFEAMFHWLSGGYFPSEFRLQSYYELRFMFVFLGTGFAALSGTFVLLYRHALRSSELLSLNELELAISRRALWIWMGSGAIGLLLVVLALLVPDPWVSYTGFVLFLIAGWVRWVEVRGRGQSPQVVE